jgi:hypothetical protein
MKLTGDDVKRVGDGVPVRRMGTKFEIAMTVQPLFVSLLLLARCMAASCTTFEVAMTAN